MAEAALRAVDPVDPVAAACTDLEVQEPRGRGIRVDQRLELPVSARVRPMDTAQVAVAVSRGRVKQPTTATTIVLATEGRVPRQI